MDQPTPGTRLYSAHLDHWVEVIGDDEADLRTFVRLDPPDLADPVAGRRWVPTVGLMPSDHYPAQIDTHDAEGMRTFGPIGEVCAGCSDQDAGRWVPVDQCPTAWRIYGEHADAHGFGAYLWLT